jgi:hypothetical protein
MVLKFIPVELKKNPKKTFVGGRESLARVRGGGTEVISTSNTKQSQHRFR